MIHSILDRRYLHFRFYPGENDELLKEPRDEPYQCPQCESRIRGRVLVAAVTTHEILGSTEDRICRCSCGGVTTVHGGGIGHEEFTTSHNTAPIHPDSRWPKKDQAFFLQAAQSFSIGLYTATAMLCRRILMVSAVREKAKEHLGFQEYANYLASKVLKDDRIRETLKAIADIGNDANHRYEDIEHDEAAFMLEGTKHFLSVLYSAPKPPSRKLGKKQATA